MKEQDIEIRKLMELAVKAMVDSIPEIRVDGKITPKVGAVIKKIDGFIDSAYRGEFRSGDHAEYTLLERKNGCTKLDGSILFTTLEPCAPGSRKEGKSSCAERIEKARIQKVWIGIQDPDPAVSGKGQKHLEDKGIEINFFDPDLQQLILEENKEFIAQALERAAEAKKSKPVEKPKTNILEQIYPKLSISDFSSEAVDFYKDKAHIAESTNSPRFIARLVNQGLLAPYGKGESVTGLGYLLFGKTPRDILPQAGLAVTVRSLASGEEALDFSDPIILIPNKLEHWLITRFPPQILREQMVHQKQSILPMKIIRESVINALIHRDYDMTGTKCHLIITDNEIEVKSPGKPINPITLDQLNLFKAPMMNRNPRLSYIFSLCGFAEERGLGMKSFNLVERDFSLPKPFYKFDDPYLVFTQLRNQNLLIRILPASIINKLSEFEKAGLELLFNKGEFTREEYQNVMGITYRTAQRQLGNYVTIGVLIQIGVGPSVKYKLNINLL